MKSNISPKYYYDEEIFIEEKTKIFKRNWFFVGFRSELTNSNDFLSRTITDVPVVVQNFRGEIKCFLNVCSHRFSKLQCTPGGNRPLVCPYHGWAYDKDGIPTGIPKRPLFKEFTQNELLDFRLKEFKVDFCGNLCFVNLSQDSVNLKEYLGSFHDELESLSNSIGFCVDTNTMNIKANRKVIVENTLESYHVASIHTNTFKKLGAQGLNFAMQNKHSSWTADLDVNRNDQANSKIEDLFSFGKYKIDGYKHILVFPNLLVSSTHGNSFNFSLVEPIDSRSTRFTSYVFIGIASNEKKLALLDAFTKILVDFNRKVFEEDKEICQQVQLGVLHTEQQGVLSLEEERVHAFQSVYIQLMQK